MFMLCALTLDYTLCSISGLYSSFFPAMIVLQCSSHAVAWHIRVSECSVFTKLGCCLIWMTRSLYKMIPLYTCVLSSSQTTNQHSPLWVPQPTSLSASAPSPTPSKRAAVSTRGAPRTSQWSTLCPLSQWSATPPVGAVWSTPSSTWRGAGATTPLPQQSLATKGETLLSWETQSCWVSRLEGLAC